MNYGYDSKCKNWKSEKKNVLAIRLAEMLTQEGLNDGTGNDNYKNPYIEVDGLYEGVRIRKISNLSNEQHRELVILADSIYDEVMKDD